MSADVEFEFEDPDDFSSATDTCPDCYGDSDPIDDLYYCSLCKGRGWVYVEMIEHPHFDHADIERELRRQKERDASAKPGPQSNPQQEI
ncbi:hypothetical protein [Thalassobaculum litoreum]|uniref:Uncharacterized protein n=1 Tax=Thalassobaculum litoreum DSM 18839 TaxID=1123362 RepID=A0A8G2BI47_9PROT|nr:hypothetical protein [Thalassobaculum litoreum]SDF84493.1 hypothetical protein SAMN05660686_02513 [Thalassobaculum litoreum DSM 18839]